MDIPKNFLVATEEEAKKLYQKCKGPRFKDVFAMLVKRQFRRPPAPRWPKRFSRKKRKVLTKYWLTKQWDYRA